MTELDLCNFLNRRSSSKSTNDKIFVKVFNPNAIGGTPTVEIESVSNGIDWDNGKIIFYPKEPLTKLTPEQVEAITESLRNSQGWFASNDRKKLTDRIAVLEQKIIELEKGKV